MLKKIALFTALALLLALLPGIASASTEINVLTLTALEAGGVIGPLSDYPSLDMRVEITLYDDGLFWMDYYNKGQQSDSIGAWEQTKNGYELYLDSGATWSLTLGSHGYYALPAGNVNMLFQASGAAGSAGQSAVDPALMMTVSPSEIRFAAAAAISIFSSFLIFILSEYCALFCPR